ncbi:hypothetical protein BC628DRAFT_1356630 [Trametes gibbosa]|nr:hypothetical protein BC628DRAFT_1356630 [Trametes gibbosa]
MATTDRSLELISKEFGVEFSGKSKWDTLRGTLSRTLKAAASVADRRSQASSQGPQQWRLPLELLEQIVDHLHNDVATLRSCALVCRSLVASVRHYLFHRIVITGKNFVNAILLFVKNPHLTGHVRELYFEGGDGTAFESLRALLEGKDPPKLLRVFALVIAPRLSNVVRLTVKDIPFDAGVVAMFASPFPRLHTLSLFDCWFRCNADLDALVRAHPGVHTLRCGRLCSRYGASDHDYDVQPDPAKLAMRSLKVTEAYSPSPLTLMPWLVTHVEPETLVYTLYRLSQVAKLNHIIAGYASMRHLHVILYHWRKEDTKEVIDCPQAMAITPYYPPNLTTLTLDAKLHSLLLAVHILAQLDPHAFVRLSTVNITAHLKVEDVEAVDIEAWAGMDQTLSVLLSLGAVNFTNACRDTTHVEAGVNAIVKRLPVLNVRKVLSFAAQKPHT